MLRIILIAALLFTACGCSTTGVRNEAHNLNNDIHHIF
jgi:hypothetical protein